MNLAEAIREIYFQEMLKISVPSLIKITFSLFSIYEFQRSSFRISTAMKNHSSNPKNVLRGPGRFGFLKPVAECPT